MRLLLLAVLVAAACDSKATTSEAGGGARAEQKSKEYESCGTSSHCQDDLRCFDQTCRRIARSTIGDYFAATGVAMKARGDLEAAIGAYSSALGHYDAAKLPLPPDVDCAYGTTLAAARSQKEHAELAARVLHRCILASPVGSRMRDQALAQLTTLAENGLDPLLLGATKLADNYLTKGAAPLATDKLTVTVTANPTPTGKSWPSVPDKLASVDVKPALISCWTAYNAASKKDTLSVSIALKVSFYGNPDYEEEGAWSTKIDPPAGGAGPEDACVRAAVEPAIKGLKLTESITSKVTITIK